MDERQPGWFPPELKLIPNLTCDVRPCTSEELMNALVSSLRAENERFSKEFPSYIAEEHCTGDNPLLDNISLMDAYSVNQGRK